MSDRNDFDFSLRVDDMLVTLICDYHNKHHAEVIAFFGDLVNSCLDNIKPNICDKDTYLVSRRVKGGIKVRREKRVTSSSNGSFFTNSYYDVWVVRGFYPDSKIPFKLNVCLFNEGTYFNQYVTTKVMLGSFKETSIVSKKEIKEMNELLAESELLDAPIDDSKIEYKLKKFRTMTPKGLKKLKKKK